MSPQRPQRPCGYPGCAALVASGYCPAHQRKRPPDTRPSSRARGYDRAWEAIRAAVLRKEPVCRYCRQRPATMVDHIVSLVRNGSSRRENLAACCHACHNRKTNAVDRGGWPRKHK